MSGAVAHIWRHPIKSHGREALERTSLIQGRTIPWDRTWAVLHAAAKADGKTWAHCANFSRGAKAPNLMAIDAKLDEATQTVTLTHPDRPKIQFHPDLEGERFLEWVAPLMPENRAASTKIVRAQDRGMTDTEFPSISLNSLTSNRAVAQKLSTDLSPLRWRGNIWFEGLVPWEEFGWVGKTIRVGSAELVVQEPITRCLATTVNPLTGLRDADTLAALKSGWGHQNFGVYAQVVKSGEVQIGDRPEVLS